MRPREFWDSTPGAAGRLMDVRTWFGIMGLGFEVQGLGFGVWGLGFEVDAFDWKLRP